jgi:hypothetical protein
MTNDESLKRVAFSPGEFAVLFGKSQTWGYRQIYSGKISAITEHGRTLIPAKEVERILEKAGIYDGKQKPKKDKTDFKKLSTEEQSTWQKFVLSRRRENAAKNPQIGRGLKAKVGDSSSQSVRDRIANSWRQTGRKQ